MKKIIFCGAVLLALCALGGPESFTDDLNRVLSRLQSMGRDSYTQAQWNEATAQIDDIESRAKEGGAWDSFVQARVIHAMVLGDMQKNYQAAVNLLQQTRRELRGKNVPDTRKVFVSLAGFYGKMGDESSVNRTMEEFRASPYYDAQDYPFSGGNGPNDPLVVMRPGAGASGSISETAMKVSQTQARFAPGAEFPDFDLPDTQGVSVTRQSFAGKVVLYDFWVKDWSAWKGDLQNLGRTYLLHHKEGFEIVGINLAPDTADLAKFCAANNMMWPQIATAKDLPAQLGLFGMCGNFLVDKTGVIVGRNLHGADLAEAVRRALAR